MSDLLNDPEDLGTSILYVRGFPEDIRRKIKAYAALTRKTIGKAVVELLGTSVDAALANAKAGITPEVLRPPAIDCFYVPNDLKVGIIVAGHSGQPEPPPTQFWGDAIGRAAVWLPEPDGLGLVHIAGIGWVEGVLPGRFVGQSLADILENRSLIRRLIAETQQEMRRG